MRVDYLTGFIDDTFKYFQALGDWHKDPAGVQAVQQVRDRMVHDLEAFNTEPTKADVKELCRDERAAILLARVRRPKQRSRRARRTRRSRTRAGEFHGKASMQREPFDPDRMPLRGEDGERLAPDVERLASDVIGAAIEVHRVLGPGFPESVYEQAMCIELRSRSVPIQQQAPFKVMYKGEIVGQGRIDLLVGDRVVVELKAVDELLPIHTSQVIAYLRARNLRLGLLLNFDVRVLRDGLKRIVL